MADMFTTTIERGLSIDRLREVLDYHAETGTFTWRTTRNNRAVAGKIAGCKTWHGYAAIKIDKRHHMAHRLAWAWTHGFWPPQEVDHENGAPQDNRLGNLRLARPVNNMHNTRGHRDSATGLKGVSLNRNGTYRSRIRVNGREMVIGTYPSPELAHAAYRQAAAEHFGEFARA